MVWDRVGGGGRAQSAVVATVNTGPLPARVRFSEKRDTETNRGTCPGPIPTGGNLSGGYPVAIESGAATARGARVALWKTDLYGSDMTNDEMRAAGLTVDQVIRAAKAAGLSVGDAMRLEVGEAVKLVRGAPVVAPPVPTTATTHRLEDLPGDFEDDEELGLDGGNVKQGVAAMARDDFATFCEYVARDEETGGRITLEQMHEEMCAAADAHPFLLVMSHPESGKTNLLVVMRVLFRLGGNTNLRIGLVSAVRGNAIKNLASIAKYIETSRELHEVFPHLRPATSGTWSTEAITVERSNIMRDPSVQTVGVHGAVQGSRLDEVYADDLLDYENTRTKPLREDTSKWFRTAILARTNRCIFLTNAWHPEDLSAELVKERGFVELRYPVLTASGDSSWPTRWPLARIAERRRTIGELEFARLYLCKPRDDGAQVFTVESVARCIDLGRGYGLIEFLDDALVHEEALIVTGVDLAVTRRMKGAVSAIYTLYVHPNGVRQIIGARSGRWGARQILDNLAAVGDAYGGVAVVEDNGAQRYLVEIAQELDTDIAIPVLPHTTGRNKIDPELGIDSMAAEFDAGRWILPSEYEKPCEEIRALRGELEVYDPASHPGDRLMAIWFARTYALRKLRRRRAQKRNGGGDVRVSVIG